MNRDVQPPAASTLLLLTRFSALRASVRRARIGADPNYPETEWGTHTVRSRELRACSDRRRNLPRHRDQREPRKRSRPAVVDREAATSARPSGSGSSSRT